MTKNIKHFDVGISFESNTTYLADQTEYHIYPHDVAGNINPWYTSIQPGDPPLVAAYIMQSLENVVIDLNGAKLVFHGRILPFAIFNCTNVIFKNFSIDYDRPFYTQGTVTDIDVGCVTLEIPELFRYRIVDSGIIMESEFWENNLNYGAPLFQPYRADATALSEHTGFILGVVGDVVKPQPNPPCTIYHLRAEQLSGRKIRLSGFPENFTPRLGEIIAFTHENRHKPGFLIENSIDMAFENIRLLHISSMAVIANLCHNLTFRNFSCYVDDMCADRIVCVNADVLHGFHCTGNIIVEDCRFENMLDDALNFHGNYLLCHKATGKRSFIATKRSAGLRDIPMHLPGDTINVYYGSTQEIKAVYTVVEADYLPGDLSHQHITVREPLNDFLANDIIESRRMPTISVRRCNSGRARGGWRISSGKRVIIEDCRFDNTPIMFTGDTNYWFENSPVRHVEIRNCIFEHFFHSMPITSDPIFSPTDKAPFYHSGISIIDNQFTDCRKGIMGMNYTSNITFKGNTIYGNENALPTNDSILLKNCKYVSIL